MKKFFALVLAVAMIMSMAAVSMAANTAEVNLGARVYDYNADTNKMTAATGFYKVGDKWYGALLSYGDTAYYPLMLSADGGTIYVKDYALVEKLKVSYEFELGEEVVESVDVVKKAVDTIAFQNGSAEGTLADVPAYMYFVAIKTKADATTADTDVIGTLEFNRKDIDAEDMPAGVAAKYGYEIDDCKVDFAFNVFYETSWLTSSKGYTIANGNGMDLKWDTDYALKFDYDDETEFNFGFNDLNEGTYTVDVSGQGKVYVRYNTKADEAIVAANPGAKMHFINFNGAKFNRTGEFTYELEDGVAAYKVVDGALVEIPGLENDDGEFSFKTRVLESYVFADAELVNPVVAAPVVDVTNPTTGA